MLDAFQEQLGGLPKFSRARDLLELDARWQVGSLEWSASASRLSERLLVLPLTQLCCWRCTAHAVSQAIDSGKEREELFEDWIAEREKAAKEAKRAEKKRKRGAFRELLERSRWACVRKGGSRRLSACFCCWGVRSAAWGAFSLLLDCSRWVSAPCHVRPDNKKLDWALFLLPKCRFIKVDSSWRKAQDRLAGEEEYEALDKLDRLEVFQEYIR